MTKRQLITELEDVMDDDAEVRIVSGSHSVMDYHIGSVEVGDEAGQVIVYLVEGSQIGYSNLESL